MFGFCVKFSLKGAKAESRDAKVEKRLSLLETTASAQATHIQTLEKDVRAVEKIIVLAKSQQSQQKCIGSEQPMNLREDLRNMEERLSTRLKKVEDGVGRMEKSQVGFFDHLLGLMGFSR